MRSACCSCSTTSRDLIGRAVEVALRGLAAGDQRYYVSDTRAAPGALGLAARAAGASGVGAARAVAGRGSAALELRRRPARLASAGRMSATARSCADDRRRGRRRVGLQPRACARTCAARGRDGAARSWAVAAAQQREARPAIRADRHRAAARLAGEPRRRSCAAGAGDCGICSRRRRRLRADVQRRGACRGRVRAADWSPSSTAASPPGGRRSRHAAARRSSTGATISCVPGLRRADAVVAPSAPSPPRPPTAYGVTPCWPFTTAARPAAAAADRAATVVLTAGRLWDEGKNVAALDRGRCARRRARSRPPGSSTARTARSICAGASATAWACLGDGRWRACSPRVRCSPRPRCTSRSACRCSKRRRRAARWCCRTSPRLRELWDGAALFVPARDADGLRGRDSTACSTITRCAPKPASARDGGPLVTLPAAMAAAHGLALRRGTAAAADPFVRCSAGAA